MAFDRNVFINCPFDDGYRPLLRPLLFTGADPNDSYSRTADSFTILCRL